MNHNATGTGRLSGWAQWAAIPGSGSSTARYTFTGLTNGKEYRYKIRAVTVGLEDQIFPSKPAPAASPWHVSATPAGPPDRPTGLNAASGFLSVALYWNDPGNSSITRYEYQVNHNDTSTGKFSGWTQWAAIPNSDASTASHTFTGLRKGSEYRYKIRAVNAVGESKPGPLGAPWFVKAVPTGPPPPPPVSKFWTERVCDHLFKVRWVRVSGATGYDLEMRGLQWKRLFTNKNYTGFKFNYWTKNATFLFRIRSVSAHGVSEWRKVKSVAPPCAVGGLRASYASNGDISVSWNAAKRADSYNVRFSSDHGKSWEGMASGISDTSHSFNKDPQSLPYSSSFLVGVQSRKGGMTSGWLHDYIARLTVTSVKAAAATLNMEGYGGDWYFKQTAPSEGSCTAGSGGTHDLTGLSPGAAHGFTAYWDAACADTIGSVTFTTPAGLSVSSIRATSVTLNISEHSGDWWYQADTGPHSTCSANAVAGNSVSLTGLTEHQQYTYKAYSASGCNDGTLLASITFEPSGDVLKVESITATTATLNLENHTGGWWFKRTAPDAGSCTAGEADFTNDLTGLIPGTEYTYKAYDVNTCGDTHESASVDFTTEGVSVSNLGEAGASNFCHVGGIDVQCATSFRTGSATNGYTLHSVSAEFYGGVASSSGFTVALYAESGSKPAATASATLSGDVPDANSPSTRTYVCPEGNSGCQLEKETDYFVVITLSTGYYSWQLTRSVNETQIPSNQGWSIGNTITTGANWATTNNDPGKMKVAATVNSD